MNKYAPRMPRDQWKYVNGNVTGMLRDMKRLTAAFVAEKKQRPKQTKRKKAK